MDQDIVIKVEHVSKKFCKNLKRSMFHGICDIVKNAIGMSSHSEKLRKDEFWALDDVSFELKKGEVLGIIGANGSGKTTILKLLNGIFWPDKGKITINGRVGALIAVGAGFHPNLTGRENIYLNGAILGMSKDEINRKIDEIIEFADIGDFIDTPVKYYSSGMSVRLGFASAIFIEPEILLIDEVLSVGDLSFQRKASDKIQDLRNKTSLVFVSHSMRQISRICDRVIWLDNGKVKEIGNASQVVSHYVEFNQPVIHDKAKIITSFSELKFNDFKIQALDQQINKIQMGMPLRIKLKFEVTKKIDDVLISLTIINSEEQNICFINNEDQKINFHEGINSIECVLPEPRLLPGKYYVKIKVSNRMSGVLLFEADSFDWNIGYLENKFRPFMGAYYEKSNWLFK